MTDEKLKAKIKIIDKKIEELDANIRKLKDEKIPLWNELNWGKKPVCDYDYYQIRAGNCPHADTYHGDIICSNPYCKK